MLNVNNVICDLILIPLQLFRLIKEVLFYLAVFLVSFINFDIGAFGSNCFKFNFHLLLSQLTITAHYLAFPGSMLTTRDKSTKTT